MDDIDTVVETEEHEEDTDWTPEEHAANKRVFTSRLEQIITNECEQCLFDIISTFGDDKLLFSKEIIVVALARVASRIVASSDEIDMLEDVLTSEIDITLQDMRPVKDPTVNYTGNA